MSNKTLTVQMRRLACTVLVFAFTIFLSGCSGKQIVGSINMSEEYASLGDVSITNGELWNELKWSANDYLTEVIEKGVIASYSDQVNTVMQDPTNENYEKYCDILKEYTVTSVLSLSEKTSDVSKSIKGLTANQINQLVAKYVDNIYLEHNVLYTSDEIINALNELKDDETSNALSFLYTYSYHDLAKYLLAVRSLELDIEEAYEEIDEDDEDDIGYFQKSTFTSKFTTKFVNQGDVEILPVRFISSNEAASTLKAFGIKTYKNNWYYIPGEGLSYSAYSTYYDDFDISSYSNESKCVKIDADYGETAILLIYVSLYNYIYTYRSDVLPLPEGITVSNTNDRRATTSSILDYVRENELTVAQIWETLTNSPAYEDYLHYTNEELNDVNSSFASYVYNTLEIDEESEDYKRYTTAATSQGSYYYLCFKYSHETNEYDEIYDIDYTTAELYDIICEYNNGELYNEVYDLVFEDKLSTTFINTCYTSLIEDNLNVKIYDEAIEIAYAANNSEYSKTHSKAPSNNVLAKVTFTDLEEVEQTFYLTVTKDEELEGNTYSAWDYLELTAGATTAIDLLSTKIIKQTDAYKAGCTDEEYDDYKYQLELMLTSFASGSYSSYGYDASIGKYNFLMLYFHTANIKDIIMDYFFLSEISQKLLTNYESETLLNFFADYSDEIYNNFFSLSGTQIQVYLDINEDGTPDDRTTWSKDVEEAAVELLDTIVNIVEASTDSHATALDSIISEYNSSSRFDNGTCTPGSSEEYDPTAPECYWAKYRKLGLYVSSTSVSVSNATTTAVDMEVKARCLDIYNNIDSFILGETFPSQYLDVNIDPDTISAEYNYETLEGYLLTEDGINLLLITGGEIAGSAEFTTDDDILGVYTDIPVIYNEEVIGTIDNVYNDGKQLTLNQIKLYLYEYLADGQSSLTPSQITSALETFFAPVLTRYQSSETQRVIILYVCYQLQNVDGIEFTYNSTVNQARFDKIIEINERIADDYIDYIGDVTGTSNDYANWWNKLYQIVPEIIGEGGAQ